MEWPGLEAGTPKWNAGVPSGNVSNLTLPQIPTPSPALKDTMDAAEAARQLSLLSLSYSNAAILERIYGAM